MILQNQAIANIYLCFKFLRLAQKWQSFCQIKLFRLKSVRRDPWSPMHIGLLMDSTLGWYLHISSFIKIGRKMTKLSSEKAIFLTKISQAWLMVTHAYRHFNGLKFGLISTHISSFIEIGRKMTKLSSEKAIFSTKITQVWRVVNHAERG